MTKEEAMEYVDEGYLIVEMDTDDYEAFSVQELRHFYDEYPPGVVDDAFAGAEDWLPFEAFEETLEYAKKYAENQRSLDFVDHTNFEFYHFSDGIPVTRGEARTRLMGLETDKPWFGRKVKKYNA